MFRNHLRIAWRNMIKDRQFTFLNVFGLAAGLACTLLIWFWVHEELSVDKFFEKGDQIFQLMEHRSGEGLTSASDESSGMLGEVLKTKIPEIEYAAALAPHEWFQKFTLSTGEKNFKAYGQYAGKDYFNIFSFKLLEGKKDKVLQDKNSIVISDELAKKLFGTTEKLIGRAVHFQQTRDFFVSGVFEKPGPHSSQQFDFVLSFEYMKEVYPWVTSWDNTGPHNFVLLKKGTDINEFNKKIANVVRENSRDSGRIAFATPFANNYLLYTFSHGSQTGSKIVYVKLFSIVALFILVIACINFMNLSTAKASRRMKEVGIKKVLGAGRRQLIIQFLSESIIYTTLAMVLAFGIVWVLLPAFNHLTGKEINLNFNASLILTLLGITIFTGLLAGSYPALYLSGFKPISILKGKLQTSIAEIFSRKGLVVFQFTLSALLIISVLVVYRQIQFIQTSDPGYSKDNVVRFNSEGRVLSNEDAFVDELKKIPGVVNACYTWHDMIGRNYGDYGISWEGKDPNERDYMEGFGGGFGFIETMGMQVVAGRPFSKEYGDEKSKIMLNESAVKLMHMKDPIGKTIHYGQRAMQIIGVVKDFHYESLHEPVKPCFITLDGPGNIWHKMMVKIKGGEQSSTLNAIQNLYASYNPGFPFEYGFLDEAYQKQYVTESRVGILSRYFAGLAIVISCLGLFGLATFTAQKRQKEIGIRKVIGASVNNIVFMLSKDFLRLILLAVLIAFPLSWWMMNQWLHGFAYRVEIGLEVFLITGTSVVLITLITISTQAIRAALANPVSSLRSE
jgi:predicted permease